MSTGRAKYNENPPQVAPLFSPPRDDDDEWGFHDHVTPSGISPNRYYQRSPQVVPLTESPSASFTSRESDDNIQGPPAIIRIPSRGVLTPVEKSKRDRKLEIASMAYVNWTGDIRKHRNLVHEKLRELLERNKRDKREGITQEEYDDEIEERQPTKCGLALEGINDIVTCQPIWWLVRWISEKEKEKEKRQGGRKTRRRRRKRNRTIKRKTKKRKSLFKKKRTKRRKRGYGGKSPKRTKRRKR